MILHPVFLAFLIENPIIIKFILWVSLILLGIYIFFLEGRAIVTKTRMRIIAFKMKLTKQHVDSAEYLEMRSYFSRSLKWILTIWFILIVLTTVLTFTY